MSYTPGPWKLNTADGRLPEVREIKMPHGEAATYRASVVAENREHVCNLDFGYGKPYDVANARLIVAAPDMLTALKDLRAMIIGEHGASAYENVNGERADAAIAKAEGRQGEQER